MLVTVADLPEGGGHTSRLKTLVQALVAGGHRVQLWNQHGMGTAPEELQSVTGEIHGAPFRYVLGTTKRGSGFGAIGTKLRAVRVIAGTLRQAHAQKDVDVLWFNQLSFYDTYPLTLLAHRLNICTVQSYEDERLEHVTSEPLSLARTIFGINSRLADRYCPAQADGIVVISHYLKDKYAPLAGDPSKVHLVPTIVDCAQWECGREPDTTCPTVLYSGAFGEQDEVEKLLWAFVLLRSQGHAFRVVMLGDNKRNPAKMAVIRDQIERLGLSTLVELRGFVPLSAVREQMRQSHILLNVRRAGMWSRSGLSTKLSEYLASGRMVITSSVGDVTQYVRDGESAVVVPATATAEEIAAAIARGLASPENRRAIGAAGRAVALRYFDVPVVTANLQIILEDVLKRRN